MAKRSVGVPKHVKVEAWLHDAITENLHDNEKLLDLAFRGRNSNSGVPAGWSCILAHTQMGKTTTHGVVWSTVSQPTYADVQQQISKMREVIDASISKSRVSVTKNELKNIPKIGIG